LYVSFPPVYESLIVLLLYADLQGYCSNKKINDIHGGKLEAGESPEECVTREVPEESGLSIRDLKYCGGKFFSAKFECEGDEMRGYHVVLHFYE